MKPAIAKAAVIGAGSMGSGIAAQFANGGVPVVLLDIPAKEGPRNAYAEGGVQRQLKANGFMHPEAARLVTTGNTEDDLGLLGDADIIIEAIIEDLGTKRDLFAKLEKVRKKGSIVSSNTSTIRLAELVKKQSDEFAGDFVITHFFNPPRQMRLVEVLGGDKTNPEIVAKAGAITDHFLGKTVISCKDTPGFIANRIGVGSMGAATMAAFELGLTEEEADAVWGTPIGIPRTGVFGLHDLIGIDVMILVNRSMLDTVPAGDRALKFDFTTHPVFKHLIEQKLLGVKTKAGFYKRIAGTKAREAMDFATLTYRPEQPADLPSLKAAGKDLFKLVSGDDKASRYAWKALSQTVLYSAEVAPGIANDIAAIDTAMQLGYNWQWGPFGLADKVGTAYLAERLAKEGEPIPPLLEKAVSAGGFYAESSRKILSFDGDYKPRPRASGVLLLSELKSNAKPVLRNESAALWDLGDGVANLELQTKSNVFDPKVFELIQQAVERVPQGFKALVVGNEHPSVFSAGANLAFMSEGIKAGNFASLEAFIADGQKAFRALKFAPFPMVGAAFGAALGGGCEVLLHCDALVAHCELNAGLPEVSVGLIPGWGGCTQQMLRWNTLLGAGAEPGSAASSVFEIISAARSSKSALDARDMGILRSADTIVMNRDRLLAAAKAKAIELADKGYAQPIEGQIRAAGAAGKQALMERLEQQAAAGEISPHTVTIGGILTRIVTGGDAAIDTVVTESDLLRLEREAIGELLRHPASLARMEHFLATGKPLAN